MMKLDYHIFKGAVNSYLSLYTGGKERPAYFDIAQTVPALDGLTRAYPDVKAELDNVLRERPRLKRYQDIDPGEAKITNANPGKDWNVFMLYILGHRPEANRALCPKTCAVLDRIPGLIQAFFSVLDPGKSVPAHEGPYYGYLRYHLGLQVPTDNPPKLVVDGKDYVWREGEAVLFDDSHTHEVVNHSNQTRAVLIVDVMRPMPFMPTLLNRFVTNVVARHTYGRSVMKRIKQAA
jgi:aspartyl/asparaginyl beta-hydroxylase (cupin superfamily)